MRNYFYQAFSPTKLTNEFNLTIAGLTHLSSKGFSHFAVTLPLIAVQTNALVAEFEPAREIATATVSPAIGSWLSPPAVTNPTERPSHGVGWRLMDDFLQGKF